MNVQSVFCSFVVLVLLQRATAGPHAYVHPKERFAASTVRMGLVAGVQVSVSTRDMRSNNEPIVVTVAGVPGPDIGDLVAMYAPAAASPDTVVPVNWAHVATGNPDYTTTGFAQVSFKLINFRQDMRFRLLRNSTFSPVVIGESPVVANHIKDQPSQVHLALHADGSSMVVQWNSGSQAPQTVQYGTTPPSSSAMAWPTSQPGSSNGAAAGPATSESSVLTYTADMMCGPPANGIGFLHPGHMHQALIPLAAFPPNTRVYYRVGSPGAGWSDTFSFVTPPPPGGMGTAGGGAAFKFLMFADVGQADPILFTNSICPPYCPKGAYNWSPDYAINSTLLVPKIVAEEDVQLGLLLGDVAYANGYAPDWDVFGHQFQPAFTKWPLMAIPGNHERNAYGTGDAMQNQSNDSGGDCNVPFTYRMYTPAATLWARPAQQTPASISSSSSSRDGKQPAGGVAATGDRIPVAASRRLSATPQHHQQQQEEEGLPHASTKAKPHVPPRPGPLDPWRSYYAFTMGPVAFVLLDTETFSHHGSEQRQYVAQELAKVDRSVHPWLVVGMHRMMMAPSKFRARVVGDVENMERLQRDYEGLFREYGVDLVLFGHEHAYSRSCPWYQGACLPTETAMAQPQVELPSSSSREGCGRSGGCSEGSSSGRLVETYYDAAVPVYILAGNAGAGLTDQFPEPMPPSFKAYTQTTHGYLRLTATRSSLLVEAVASLDGSRFDTVQLVKRSG